MEGSGIDTIKDEAITFAGEPAWQVEYITNYQGIQLMYGKSIFVVKDGKLFDIGFTMEPLKVPEMSPIGEKSI